MAIRTAVNTTVAGTRARTRPAPYAPTAPMSGYQTQQQQAVRQQTPSALTAMPRPQQPAATSIYGPRGNTGIMGGPAGGMGAPAIPGGRPIGQMQTAQGQPTASPVTAFGNQQPRPGYQPYASPPQAPRGGWPQATPPSAPTYPGAPPGQAYAPTAPPDAYKSRSDELIYSGMQRRDLPFAAWELNEDQRMQAELDRIRGYEELARARNAIGTDPAAQQARELALERAMNGGLFDDPYLDQQRGLIRNRGSIGMEAARRNLQDSLAQRGIEGGLSAYEMAQLDQSGALGIQEQLGGFEQEARAAQAQERAQGLEQLLGLTGREEASRSALDQAIANVFLETERAPFDVSELMQPVRKGKKTVGGKKDYKKPPNDADKVASMAASGRASTRGR